MDRWFRLEHALHWAGALFGVLVLCLVVAQTLRYGTLARRGVSATATVVAYQPRRAGYRSGYTYHDHLLDFAGRVERVELSRMRVPGSTVRVVYLPDRPSVAVEVAGEGKPGDLLGVATLVRLLLFGLGGLALLGWGVRGLFKTPSCRSISLAGTDAARRGS